MRRPALALVTVLFALGTALMTVQATGSAHAITTQRATIDYAVDGDTLRVRLQSGSLAYVRLIGIDSPEDVKPDYPVECGAEAASASMRRLAPEGASILLVGDSVASAYDRYGRILAHAFVDGRQLEIAQLRKGLAYVYIYEGRSFDGLAHFEHVQQVARREDRGSWKRCGGDFHSAEPGIQN